MKIKKFATCAALCLAVTACGSGPKGAAIKAARDEIGDQTAQVEGLREVWTPTYQKAVCGRIRVGIEQSRFVSLLTSDDQAVSAMVEGADLGEKEAFEETIWRPACGV